MYYVYMTTNKAYGVLYTGITSQLSGRNYEHKEKVYRGFTQKYNADKLVWYEEHSDVNNAIYREKTIKRWKREWKIKLIEEMNPTWKDQYTEIL